MASTEPKRLRPRNNFSDETYEQFICEAYGCKPFEISVVKLSTAAIARIKMEMKDRLVDKTMTPRVLSRGHTRVPLPVRNIVVRSINHECKFCKKFFSCFSE